MSDISDETRSVVCTNEECPEKGIAIELPAGWDLDEMTCGGSDFTQSPAWFCHGPLTALEAAPK